MSEIIKVVKNEWHEIDTVLCAVFIGQNSMRNDISYQSPYRHLPCAAGRRRGSQQARISAPLVQRPCGRRS
jgi:hypothetical protein